MQGRTGRAHAAALQPLQLGADLIRAKISLGRSQTCDGNGGDDVPSLGAATLLKKMFRAEPQMEVRPENGTS